MGFKTVLVFVDTSKHAAQTLSVALDLAGRFEGHVIGLHVRPRFQAPAFTESSFAVDTLFRAHLDIVRSDEAAATATFEKARGAARRSSEWRVRDGFADVELAIAARYADLVVVGQTDPQEGPPATPPDLAEHVALNTERPVLVVPHVGAAKAPGEVALLCWNNSRESARAATAALPLLKKAAKVIVLTVDPKRSEHGQGAEPGADVAEWLSRHGVKATVQRDSAADAEIGGLILSRAADHGADVIVMGIYGHSRMRERVLGGVSRTLLSHMTVPLLIAH